MRVVAIAIGLVLVLGLTAIIISAIRQIDAGSRR
jgi:hypothetical protein